MEVCSRVFLDFINGIRWGKTPLIVGIPSVNTCLTPRGLPSKPSLPPLFFGGASPIHNGTLCVVIEMLPLAGIPAFNSNGTCNPLAGSGPHVCHEAHLVLLCIVESGEPCSLQLCET